LWVLALGLAFTSRPGAGRIVRATRWGLLAVSVVTLP
jgi:hypothetical protein